MPDFASFDPNNLLLGQWNGKFAEAGDAAGIALNRKGRGALIADFNLDGKLEALSAGVYRLEGQLLVVLDIDRVLDLRGEAAAA